MGFSISKSFKRATKSVSKAVQDAGESVGKSVAGSSGRKAGRNVGAALSYGLPGGQVAMAEDVGKAVGGAAGSAIQSAGSNDSKGMVGAAAQAALGAPQAAGAPTPAVQTPAQGLPPTGIDQQLASINQFQQAAEGVLGQGSTQASQMTGTADDLGGSSGGSTNIQQLAQSLAKNYGLSIGRGNIVDDQGNFLVTPDQLAGAGGDTMGTAAAKMNYISQAIARQQNEQQQAKGISALQTGLGQVQSRGRGSLASLQSGMYEGLADMYSNQEYESADFSYFIQKEQMDIAQDLMRRQEKLAKKQARSGFIGGIGMGILGAFTGNVGMAAGGIGQAAGSAGGTGWF